MSIYILVPSFSFRSLMVLVLGSKPSSRLSLSQEIDADIMPLLVLTKLGYLIDNPWNNALDRTRSAGLDFGRVGDSEAFGRSVNDNFLTFALQDTDYECDNVQSGR